MKRRREKGEKKTPHSTGDIDILRIVGPNR
jgi:hypothetical protein